MIIGIILVNDSNKYMTDLIEDSDDLGMIRYLAELDSKQPSKISISENYIFKGRYTAFEKNVGFLYKFLKIFKADLKKIEIDKKEDQGFYSCDLIMVYDDYKIHAEFESTGIKKLIRLFAYLQMAVSPQTRRNNTKSTNTLAVFLFIGKTFMPYRVTGRRLLKYSVSARCCLQTPKYS